MVTFSEHMRHPEKRPDPVNRGQWYVASSAMILAYCHTEQEADRVVDALQTLVREERIARIKERSGVCAWCGETHEGCCDYEGR